MTYNLWELMKMEIPLAVREESLNKNVRMVLESPESGEIYSVKPRRFGLGIDAGGTYTDAVIFDFTADKVLYKAKALTTKWKYSEGIMNAVNQLPHDYRRLIDQVSVSTTLVTNAVVESNQRPVGLLLMPNGDEVPKDLKHQPRQVIKGRLTISGDVNEDIDKLEIISTVRSMISQFHVEAFAVSAYGGSINPVLELQVKEIIRRETGLEVCCGHELSGTLNFSVRAVTAVLNAGVMPIMEDFLKEMELSIEAVGINAPLMVVRGDGAVMSETYAREFPVQTALSGPAASMAGAMFLTGTENAVVIDVGGTTSDIGFLEKGRVSVCDMGARIGEWDTHVKAVDMLTSGLGGDSEIFFHRLNWTLGPKRITPVSWLSSVESHGDNLRQSLQSAREQAEDWSESTIPLQFLFRTGKDAGYPLTSREQVIYDALADGPLMLWQLMEILGTANWKMVKSGRLESSGTLQRAGLTPTDVFHFEGNLGLWDKEFAASYMDLISQAAGLDPADLAGLIRNMITEHLGNALLQKILGKDITQGNGIDHILNHGNDKLSLIPRITIPVIGLGAPASLMLADAAVVLNAPLTLCDDGDVANAVGAITSRVSVSRRAGIAVTRVGGFRINGLESTTGHFESLEDAEEQCIRLLVEEIRIQARRAGTSESEITMNISSEVSFTTEGAELFLGRTYLAEIHGIPDLVR